MGIIQSVQGLNPTEGGELGHLLSCHLVPCKLVSFHLTSLFWPLDGDLFILPAPGPTAFALRPNDAADRLSCVSSSPMVGYGASQPPRLRGPSPCLRMRFHGNTNEDRTSQREQCTLCRGRSVSCLTISSSRADFATTLLEAALPKQMAALS